MENITIIIPAVRQDSAQRALRAAEVAAPGAKFWLLFDTEGTGCSAMVDYMVRNTSTDLILFLGDDTEIQPGAMEAAMAKMTEFKGGWGMVGLNTQPGKPFAHWLAHKKMLDLTGGKFFSTEYKHNYCDQELYDISVENGRWAWAEDAKVIHHHPGAGVNMDDHYAFGRDTMEADRATYYRRKRDRKNGGIAIGFPLVDDHIPVQFFTSFACMEKPSEYRLLVPQFPHGPWTGSLAEARNSLVQQALDDGCSHLLMLDTDQVYPADTLTRLLSHNVNICGVRVHRRWMPFDPIFLRGDLGRYKSVPEDEMYSGDLIQVDATGTGCLLFNMDVFLKVQPPWFAFGVNDGKPVGEDINFCSKARAAGVEIYVDTAIEVGHLVTMTVNKSLHQICKHMTANVPK